MWKEKNDNQDHVRVRCLDRNGRGSAVQRMDDVKEDRVSDYCWLHAVDVSYPRQTQPSLDLLIAFIINMGNEWTAYAMNEPWS